MKLEKVKFTKFELINLKKRLKSYKRIHRILKDQQEVLIKHFMQLIKQLKSLEKEYNKAVNNLKNSLIFVEALVSEDLSSILYSQAKVFLDLRVNNLYGAKLLEGDLEIKLENLESYIKTPMVKKIFKDFEVLVKILLKIAILQENIKRVGELIKETKKRVNLLENELIPSTERKIKLIKERLDDFEREEKARLIFIKENLLKTESFEERL